MAKIIAECCQNHKGDRSILQDMIWQAAEAGADYVKVQSILADELTRRERFEEGETENGVQTAIKRPYAPEHERLKPMDLGDEAHEWFIDECKKADVKPLTTVFTRARIPFAGSLPWPERAIKVASYDCASYPMLRELMEHFDYLFISTGATYDEEIERTSEVLGDHSFTLMHCVTIYPTPLDVMNLARLDYLRQFTPSVGFSDHSLVRQDGLKASIAAMAHGADVVERHFTVLAEDETKDGPVSINPEQLAELVRFARMPQADVQAYVEENIPERDVMIGQEHRELTHGEKLNRDYYRGRFAAHQDGEVIYNWEEKEVAAHG